MDHFAVWIKTCIWNNEAFFGITGLGFWPTFVSDVFFFHIMSCDCHLEKNVTRYSTVGFIIFTGKRWHSPALGKEFGRTLSSSKWHWHEQKFNSSSDCDRLWLRVSCCCMYFFLSCFWTKSRCYVSTDCTQNQTKRNKNNNSKQTNQPQQDVAIIRHSKCEREAYQEALLI